MGTAQDYRDRYGESPLDLAMGDLEAQASFDCSSCARPFIGLPDAEILESRGNALAALRCFQEGLMYLGRLPECDTLSDAKSAAEEAASSAEDIIAGADEAANEFSHEALREKLAYG